MTPLEMSKVSMTAAQQMFVSAVAAAVASGICDPGIADSVKKLFEGSLKNKVTDIVRNKLVLMGLL